MIVALDVAYAKSAATARAAAVVFERWEDAAPVARYTAEIVDVEPYVPGEFYRRELPCLLAVLHKVHEPLQALVIDGFVALGDQPGLGMHLWRATGEKYSVIGVAKTPFRGTAGIRVSRGRSRLPLHVTSAGIAPHDAAQCILRMHGRYRIPTLLKMVDRLAAKGTAQGRTSPSRGKPVADADAQ
jgi:deoxyribonuclease V